MTNKYKWVKVEKHIQHNAVTGKFRLDYRDENGERRFRSGFETRRAAREALDAIMTDRRRGQYGFIKVKTPLFQELAREYIVKESRLTKHTWKDDEERLRKYILPAFGKTEINKITTADVTEWKGMWVQKITKSTVNRILTLFKRILNWAIEQDMGSGNSRKRWNIMINPVKYVEFFKEPPPRNRILTLQERMKLFSELPEMIKRILVFAEHTGMRSGEIYGIKGLRWNQIDFERNIAVLYETKNGESREVPLNSVVINILEQMPRYGEYIFSKLDGSPVISFRNVFYAALKRAGIENFRQHDFRHAFITSAKEAGLDTEAIMSITGHKSWYMHKRYDHPSMERKRRVVEVMAKKNGYKMDTEAFGVSEPLSKYDIYQEVR